MRILFFLIFILVIAGIIFFLFVRYDQKISSLHRDNILLKKQLSKLKEQLKFLDNSKDTFTIQFLNVDNQYGLISKGTLVHLSPYDNSNILQNITIAMEVGILEKALVNNTTWYYVALPVDTNVNSRGWVVESSFSTFSSSYTKIVPN